MVKLAIETKGSHRFNPKGALAIWLSSVAFRFSSDSNRFAWHREVCFTPTYFLILQEAHVEVQMAVHQRNSKAAALCSSHPE